MQFIMFGVNALQVKPVANGGRYEPTFFHFT